MSLFVPLRATDSRSALRGHALRVSPAVVPAGSIGSVADAINLVELDAPHLSGAVQAWTLAFGFGLGLWQQRRRAARCRRSARTQLHSSAAPRGDATDARFQPGQPETLDVVVVGSGVSGLCAAFGVLRENPSVAVALTEAGDRVGGIVTTVTRNGRLWEEGPNSFQPSDEFLTTACDVGLQDDIILADPRSYRYVWWGGRLRPLPMSPSSAIFGDFLSLRGKLRAALGAIGLAKAPMPQHEESIKDFVTRNLGEEAYERLVDPFISGVYAGDPAKLSAEAAIGRVHTLEKKGGSLMAGVRQLSRESKTNAQEKPPRDPRLPNVKGQTVGSFRGGLISFPNALRDKLDKMGVPVRLQWKLTKLFWDQDRQEHVLDYETPEGHTRLRSRSVVLTAPSHIAAELLRPLSSLAAEALEEIRYPRVAALTVEYPRSAFREPEHGKGPVNGFGQLHPRSQGIRTLGTIYVSSLFPDRLPDPDKVMLQHFIGGARDPELFGGIDNLSESELVEATHRDTVKTMLKPSAADDLPQVHGVRVWQKAIPQFEIGHSERLEQACAGLESEGVKGLFLAGNYVGGVALRQCVKYGLDVAKEVVAYVDSFAKQPQYAEA